MIETILSIVNASACGLISLVLGWMILSPKFHDGLVMKSGLILMALGFGAIALLIFGGLRPSIVQGLGNGLLLINAGIALVIIGYLRRKARDHHQARRSTDWAELLDESPR